MTPFHEYSYYLQVAERNLKQLDEWLNLTDAVRKAMHMMDKGAV